MEATELLATRRSCSKLGEPAPSGEVWERIARSALRAPDHGTLRPWNILLFRGEARNALGELMAAHAKRAKPDIGSEELERERRKPLRAPLVIAVAARVSESPKAPAIEQLLSAGCVAYGLVLGLQAEGFGAIWRTGDFTYAKETRAALGLADTDALVGFIYAGTPTSEPPEGNRPDPAQFVTEWTGPAT